MHYLALDVGTRRTGVAFGDSVTGIPLPLETVQHHSSKELFEAVLVLVSKRSVDEIILGLPLLPDGSEGSQADIVRSFADLLTSAQIPHSFVDERYTTPRSSDPPSDPDSAAACAILGLKLANES